MEAPALAVLQNLTGIDLCFKTMCPHLLRIYMSALEAFDGTDVPAYHVTERS